MKIKPNRRDVGSVMVELGPNERAIPGVAADRSLNPVPVFGPRRILVPVDFSECSQKALQYATPLARQSNAELTVLHVVEPYRAFCPEIPLCDLPTDEAARAALDGLAIEVPFEVVVREGEPYTQIVAAAKELDIDLIVLSTHGRTGMAHVFMGSTTEKVVRHAPCPVLIVRQQEHEFVVSSP